MDRCVSRFSRFVSSVLVSSIVASGICSFPAYAEISVLPMPNSIVDLSIEKSAPMLKGLKFDPNNPLNIQFVIDTAGNKEVSQEEASQLIRYFLTSLTVPESDLWVNLSPYESDRIIDNELAETELGQEMLAQDYMLKQLGSSLTHPDKETGEQYWKQVHEKGAKVDTFNKIWIMPDAIEIYEGNNNAYITKSTLKVMTEADYMAQEQNTNVESDSSSTIKETILPEISKDVNAGENFASLRQMYNAIILGTWFKKKFQESFYSFYFDAEKLQGIDKADEGSKEKIYNMYVEAFKTGAYNFIKKEYDANSNVKVKRNYFSGGANFDKTMTSAVITLDENNIPHDDLVIADSNAILRKPEDHFDEKIAVAASAVINKEDVLNALSRRDNFVFAGVYIKNIPGSDDNSFDITNGLLTVGNLAAEADLITEFQFDRRAFPAIKRFRKTYKDRLMTIGGLTNLDEVVDALTLKPNVIMISELLSDNEMQTILAKANNAVVVVAVESEEQIKKALNLGVDGIKIKPFALSKRALVKNLKLITKYKDQYPNVLFGGAGGVTARNIDQIYANESVDFVGSSVAGREGVMQTMSQLEWLSEVTRAQRKANEFDNKSSLTSFFFNDDVKRKGQPVDRGQRDENLRESMIANIAEHRGTYRNTVGKLDLGDDGSGAIYKRFYPVHEMSSSVRLDDAIMNDMLDYERYLFEGLMAWIPEEKREPIEDTIRLFRPFVVFNDISQRELDMMKLVSYVTEYSKLFMHNVDDELLSKIEAVKDYADESKGIKDIKANEVLASAKKALPENYSKEDLINMQAKIWVELFNDKIVESGVDIAPLDIQKDRDVILGTAAHDIYSAGEFLAKYPSAKLVAAMAAAHHDKTGLRFFIKEYGVPLNKEQIQRAEYLLSMMRMIHALHKGETEKGKSYRETFDKYIAPVQAKEEQFSQEALTTIEKLISSSVTLDDVFYSEFSNAQRYGFDNMASKIPTEIRESVDEVVSIIRDIRMKGDISAKEFVMMEKLAFATELSKSYDVDISSHQISLIEEVKDYKDKDKGIKDIKSNEILAEAKKALPYSYSKDDLINMQAKLWVEQYNAKLGAFNASFGAVRDNLPPLDLEKDSEIVLRTAVHDIYSAEMIIKRFPNAKLMAAMVAAHHDKLGLRFFIKEYGAELSEDQIQRAEYLLSILRMVHALHKGQADYGAAWIDTFNSYIAPVQVNEEQFGQDALATIEKLVSSSVSELSETVAKKELRDGGITLKGIGDNITAATGSSSLTLPIEMVKAVSGISFRVVELDYVGSARMLYANKWK